MMQKRIGYCQMRRREERERETDSGAVAGEKTAIQSASLGSRIPDTVTVTFSTSCRRRVAADDEAESEDAAVLMEIDK